MENNRIGRFSILVIAFIVFLSACGGDVKVENVADPQGVNIVVTDSVAPVNDRQVPFGSVQQGASSDQTVTITNQGTADLVISTIASANTLTAPFSISADTCSGQTIAPVGSCTLTVRFAPTGTGLFTDSFDIPSDDPGAPTITISISGTGTATLVPDISVTDSVNPNNDLQLPFGIVTQGSTTNQTVTVKNNGTTGLVVGTVASANPLASPFSITVDNCSGQTIAPAGNCTMTVRFAPTGTGSFTDGFDIPSNDPDTATVTVSVSGTANPVPDIVVTDSVAPGNDHTVPFGSMAPGDTSNQTVTVTNNGTTGLVVGTVASANPLASPFSITADNCSGQTIAPAGNCTMTVRFAPTGTGSFTDSFDIPSNDPDTASVTLTLSGTGIVVTNTIALPRTGQTICSSETGTVISCAGTGQDGDLLKGAVWPSPRFTVGIGGEVNCVTDNLTGMMWAKNGNLAGLKSWQAALEYVAAMNSGAGLCGYTDWRLPNRRELSSLVDYSRFNPALSAGHPFTGVQSYYWSSSTYRIVPSVAWVVNMIDGGAYAGYDKALNAYVWPVRAGQ